ncbi:hypothetical protein B0H14DRAFT_3157794 [Mycena olivaceomarginata]|nr:hypothetical protein B0H14DRAFT_3157794 [Mycena olivaceomarginata]
MLWTRRRLLVWLLIQVGANVAEKPKGNCTTSPNWPGACFAVSQDRGITGASIRYNFMASSCDLPAVSSCPCHPYAPLAMFSEQPVMCDCTRRPRSIAVPIHYCPKIPTPTAVIRDLRDLSSDTDSEIAWREPAVDPLLCELVKLRRRAEYISPIRRVPPEIMAEIFLHLTAIDLILGTWDHGDEELFEMERKHKVEPVPHRTPLIFGEVSRALPLSIRFYRVPSSDAVPREVLDHYQNLLWNILPYAGRWRLLDLKDLAACSYHVLHAVLPNSVPMLETLSAGLRTSPKLRRVHFDTIGGATIVIGGEWSTFPWSQLTHIHVGQCSAHDCFQILSGAWTAVACRHLEVFAGMQFTNEVWESLTWRRAFSEVDVDVFDDEDEDEEYSCSDSEECDSKTGVTSGMEKSSQ